MRGWGGRRRVEREEGVPRGGGVGGEGAAGHTN